MTTTTDMTSQPMY